MFDINDILGNENNQNGNEQQLSAAVPIFLCKVWQLVNDEKNKELISWSASGNSFIIHDPVRTNCIFTYFIFGIQANFAKQVLPNYFKHQRVDSFIRQLNMYGFKKVLVPLQQYTFVCIIALIQVQNIDLGSLKSQCDEVEYSNEKFLRGRPDLLDKVKRKDNKRQLVLAEVCQVYINYVNFHIPC